MRSPEHHRYNPGKINDSPFNFQPLGNTGDGILIQARSTQNTIGGASAGAGNLLVSNQSNRIEIGGSSDSNVISGNAIGTTLSTGSGIGIGPPVNLGNAAMESSVSSSSANTIGGVNSSIPKASHSAGRQRSIGQWAKRHRIVGEP